MKHQGQNSAGIITEALFVLVFLSLAIPAMGHAQTAGDQSSDAECKPITDTKCGCGLVFNSKTGSCEKGGNKYECICSQTDNGKTTTGTCDEKGVCKAIQTGGKAVQLPPGAPSQSGAAPASGVQPTPQNAAPQVTPASGISAPQPAETPTPATGPGPQTQPAQDTLVPGTSVLDNSLKWLTGASAPTDQTSNVAPSDSSNENVIFNPQPLSSQSNALSDQGQPQPSQTGAPTGTEGPNPDYQPSSQGTLASQPMGNLPGLTDTQAQAANSYAQDTLTGQSPSTPQNASDVTATIYYPGCVGGPSGCSITEEGGLYGSKNNYLDPSVPTVAAGPSSGYQYGQVVSITNSDTGQSVNAVVGDKCPDCGSGIDLTPAAANAVGLTQDQGRANVQVAVVANTGNYSSGSQMAVALNSNPYALDPWSAPPAVTTVSYTQPNFASLSASNDWTQVASASSNPVNAQPSQSAQYYGPESNDAFGSNPNQTSPIINPPLPPEPSTYQGSSLVDYLNSTGQDISFAARQALAAGLGVANYIGSAAQNLLLLKGLRGY